MLRTIFSHAICILLSVALLCGCKEKKKTEVTDTEAKTQYGKAVGAAESLKEELNNKNEKNNQEMNDASNDE